MKKFEVPFEKCWSYYITKAKILKEELRKQPLLLKLIFITNRELTPEN